LIDFMVMVGKRVHALEAVDEHSRPVLLPSYGGTRRMPNLTALLALLLRRYGIPVLVHGPGEAARECQRVTTIAVLRELGIEPVKSITEAQRRIVQESIAYVPISLIAPEIADVLELQAPFGLHGDLRGLAQLIDPFGGAAFRVVGAWHPGDLPLLQAYLRTTQANALLLRATHGEPFADPRRQPRLESFVGGVPTVLFDAAHGPPAVLAGLPRMLDASTSAEWITAVLEGEQPVPAPIVNQLACCLLSGRRAA